MIKLIGLVAVIVVLLLISYFGVSVITGGKLGFTEPLENFEYIYFAIATFVGVFISTIVSALRSLPQNQAVGLRRFADALLRPNTFVALVVSPIVLLGILTALDAESIGFLQYMSALQNGFFGEQIIAGNHDRHDVLRDIRIST